MLDGGKAAQLHGRPAAWLHDDDDDADLPLLRLHCACLCAAQRKSASLRELRCVSLLSYQQNDWRDGGRRHWLWQAGCRQEALTPASMMQAGHTDTSRNVAGTRH